jgi:hypothetical protein
LGPFRDFYFDNCKNMHQNLDSDDVLVQCEGFEKFSKIEVEGDSVLFAMLSGLLEQTIRCRRLDVANTFNETLVRKVYKLKVEVQHEHNRLIYLRVSVQR